MFFVNSNGLLPLTFTFAPIFNFKVRSYRTANTVIFMSELCQLHSSLWYVNREKIWKIRSGFQSLVNGVKGIEVDHYRAVLFTKSLFLAVIYIFFSLARRRFLSGRHEWPDRTRSREFYWGVHQRGGCIFIWHQLLNSLLSYLRECSVQSLLFTRVKRAKTKRILNSLHLFGLTIRILYWTKLVGPICLALFVAFFFDLASGNKNAKKT